jgi:hypothetical protein
VLLWGQKASQNREVIKSSLLKTNKPGKTERIVCNITNVSAILRHMHPVKREIKQKEK